MTRQEEIRNAIDKIIPISPSRNGRTYEQSLMATGFESGVKWADSNPKSPWISVEDDLPCNHEEMIALVDTLGKYTYDVLVRFDYGGISLANMNCRGYKQNWRWSERGIITHWMPIPKLEED